MKYRSKIENWPTPKNRAELDAFLWLIPFLRIFIPGRAAHVLEMKKAYIEQVPVERKEPKIYNDEVEEYNTDLTAPKKQVRPKRATIQRKYIEKTTFDWGPIQ